MDHLALGKQREARKRIRVLSACQSAQRSNTGLMHLQSGGISRRPRHLLRPCGNQFSVNAKNSALIRNCYQRVVERADAVSSAFIYTDYDIDLEPRRSVG
ncbi:hypothetical protein D3C85_1171160 [compost metagenome]